MEHWLVIRGTATVTINSAEKTILPGESVNICVGDIHRVQNRGKEDIVFIEIQLGEYFGEDDIERIEDDYGRA